VQPSIAATASVADLDTARAAIRQKEFSVALRELESLARGGNHDAEYLLGALLLTNPSAEPDTDAAYRWLRQAADAGQPRAAYMMSVMFATSEPPNIPEAERWLAVAAKGGIQQAEELQKAKRLPLTFQVADDLTEKDARLSAFWRAAGANDVTTLMRLSAEKTWVTSKDAFDRSVIGVAAAADARDSVAWLLQTGAVVDTHDKFGATALMLAAGSATGAAISELLSAKAAINAVDGAGNMPLHYAIRTGDADRVALLLKQGAEPNKANADGDQPMDLAQRFAVSDVVEVLRSAGAMATRPATLRSRALSDVQRPQGMSDLYAARSDLEVAATRRDPALLKVLLAKGTASNRQKSQALLAAAEAGAIDSVRELLSAGADPLFRDERKRSAAGNAMLNRDGPMLQLLLSKGVPGNSVGNSGQPLLIEAVRSGNIGIVSMFLENRADVSAADASGWTSLMIAARQDDATVLNSLLARNVSLSSRDARGRDALLHAALAGTEANVTRLLAAGGSPRTTDSDGDAALGACAARGLSGAVQGLLAAKADVNAATKSGNTPLMRAAAGDHVGAIGLLLQAGAKVDQRDPLGDTALTIAVREGATEAARLLVASGADPGLRNSNRVNAGDIAKNLKRDAIAKILAAR
jgi:ankyrin repeat protein